MKTAFEENFLLKELREEILTPWLDGPKKTGAKAELYPQRRLELNKIHTGRQLDFTKFYERINFLDSAP